VEVVGVGEEGHRFQRDGLGAYGQFPNDEAVSSPNSSEELQPSHLLQGGNSWDSEIYDHVEARLDGIQGVAKEDGMKHDGRGCNDA